MSQSMQEWLAEVNAVEEMSLADMKKEVEKALWDLHDGGEDVQLFLMQLIKKYGGDPNNPPPQYAHLALNKRKWGKPKLLSQNVSYVFNSEHQVEIKKKKDYIINMVDKHNKQRNHKINLLKKKLAELDALQAEKLKKQREKKKAKRQAKQRRLQEEKRKAKEMELKQKREREKAANKRKKMKAKQRAYKFKKAIEKKERIEKEKELNNEKGNSDALNELYEQVLFERQKQIELEKQKQTNEKQKQTKKQISGNVMGRPKKKRKRKKRNKDKNDVEKRRIESNNKGLVKETVVKDDVNKIGYQNSDVNKGQKQLDKDDKILCDKINDGSHSDGIEAKQKLLAGDLNKPMNGMSDTLKGEIVSNINDKNNKFEYTFDSLYNNGRKDIGGVDEEVQYDYGDVNDNEYDYSDTDNEIQQVMKEIDADLEADIVSDITQKEEVILDNNNGFIYHLPHGMISVSNGYSGNVVDRKDVKIVGDVEDINTKDLVNNVWETYDTYKPNVDYKKSNNNNVWK